jgi:hypothetical protein
VLLCIVGGIVVGVVVVVADRLDRHRRRRYYV